ncbi:MAG TPA: U32 family peptidase [Methanothermobacter sp.]|jgi:collagenase-like PrtC family protease|uniref:Protease n=1 Tax=Methanothermobacter tenebrarum TaxID=680118 RepID=A0ABM7YB88_9EURY|nr:peptidase U32 family protein [Methanothermobacter tenebrarum]MDD3455066.1 U32 family peptidase [Methanobacteriales archaeon]MDI6881637.1 peptidase U32 family protein [Methanothermobacter sp.]MDX9693521.1 peptidase U32 family protein [Methanothermobacter sp.]BDH79392.1 protease [Methanothermobacter tenebrarum]HHW16087.1 U32 family peptidase [Methanothermobacter sp.]
MMKFSTPLPGDAESLKEIIKELKGSIHEVYMAGPSEYMGSGRATLHSPLLEDIGRQASYAHRHNIKFKLILNSSCLAGQHLTSNGYNIFRKYLEELETLNVDTVIVSDPYLVEMISKELQDLKVGVSCIAHVDSPQRAKFFEELGADEITVDTNINRHFNLLEAIREATTCELKVIANEACLYKCPFRYSHFNLFSHITASPQIAIMGDYYFEKCISLRVRDPTLIIRSPWIRPEDIHEYEKIGIDIIKISGRANTTHWIINTMKSYLKGHHKGNLLELLDCPNELRDHFHIPNEKLEGAIRQWKTCKKSCHKCNFCENLAKELILKRRDL